MILNIDLWPHFLEAFKQFIELVPEQDLARGWSSPKDRTEFYRGAMLPLAESLGKLTGGDLAARGELFKVDFAISSQPEIVPLIFVETENNPVSSHEEIRKLVNLAAPLRVLITVSEWDESPEVWKLGNKDRLLSSWEHIIRAHHQVWPRPGIVGILVGEWHPQRELRFYAYAYGEGQRLAWPENEIFIRRPVTAKSLGELVAKSRSDDV